MFLTEEQVIALLNALKTTKVLAEAYSDYDFFEMEMELNENFSEGKYDSTAFENFVKKIQQWDTGLNAPYKKGR